MALKQILPSLYRVPLRGVNAFLIDDTEDGLILVDTGTPKAPERILTALRELGRLPSDVRHVLVTHCHVDHAGGLAELKEATGAPAYMHPEDATMVRSGRALRPLTPTPGLFNKAVVWLVMRKAPQTLRATEVEHEVRTESCSPLREACGPYMSRGTALGNSLFCGLDTVACSSRPTPRPMLWACVLPQSTKT